MNQVVLVGRIAQDLEIKEQDRKVNLTLAVNKPFKNSEGIYESDFIPCVLWDVIAEKTYEFCHKGDMIGIKGRIQNTTGEIEIIAEKVTFLSNKGAA